MTIDDHWFKKATPEGLVQAAEVDLEKVMADAEDEYVRIMLYHDRKKGDVPNEEVFNLYSALGASGMKYGFHGNQAGFTRDAMKNAAKHKVVINFHDSPCPMHPEEYPNKTDLFAILKAMPGTWDEGRVSNVTIGESITVARRSGLAWFVGSVNEQNARTLLVTLDFLAADIRMGSRNPRRRSSVPGLSRAVM